MTLNSKKIRSLYSKHLSILFFIHFFILFFINPSESSDSPLINQNFNIKLVKLNISKITKAFFLNKNNQNPFPGFVDLHNITSLNSKDLLQINKEFYKFSFLSDQYINNKTVNLCSNIIVMNPEFWFLLFESLQSKKDNQIIIKSSEKNLIKNGKIKLQLINFMLSDNQNFKFRKTENILLNEFTTFKNLNISGIIKAYERKTSIIIGLAVEIKKISEIKRILLLHPDIFQNNLSLSKDISNGYLPFLTYSDLNFQDTTLSILENYNKISKNNGLTWKDIFEFFETMKILNLKEKILLNTLLTTKNKTSAISKIKRFLNKEKFDSKGIESINKIIHKVESPNLMTVKKYDSKQKNTFYTKKNIINNSRENDFLNSDSKENKLKKNILQKSGNTIVGLNLIANFVYNGPQIKNGKITGKIYTYNHSDTIDTFRVEARMNSMARIGFSDQKGNYEITNMPLGEWKIKFSSPGYIPAFTNESFSKTAVVENDGTYFMPDLYVKKTASFYPGNAKGKVINIVSGSLMEGVAISCNKKFTLSLPDGSWYINDLNPGKIEITARASGYKEYNSKLIVVPDLETNHQILMEPSRASIAGVITVPNYYWMLDWKKVIVYVKSLSYESATLEEGGNFKLTVPALLPEYTIEVMAPFCEKGSTTISGPLYPGGTLYIQELPLKRKTISANIKVISSENCQGNLFINTVCGMQFGPVIFSGENQGTISISELPMGEKDNLILKKLKLSINPYTISNNN
jgi:hypothetical protein